MDSGRGPTEDEHDSVWPLMEQVASLDAFLEQPEGDRRPARGNHDQHVAIREVVQLWLNVARRSNGKKASIGRAF